MHLHITSDDSIKFYKNNGCWDFTIELPVPIQTDRYQIALTDVYAQDLIPGYYFVTCDVVDESLWRDAYRPLLGTFYSSGVINNPIYRNLTRSRIERIHFQITTADGKEPPLLDNPILLTIHLKSL